jgi:hypothetical protein
VVHRRLVLRHRHEQRRRLPVNRTRDRVSRIVNGGMTASWAHVSSALAAR